MELLHLKGRKLLTERSLLAITENMTSLTDLDLYVYTTVQMNNIQLIRDSLQHVAFCTKLKSLAYCQNRYEMLTVLSGEAMLSIAQCCSELSSLTLRSATEDLFEQIMGAFEYLGGLTKIDLSYSKADDTVLTELSRHCIQLTDVDLSGTFRLCNT